MRKDSSGYLLLSVATADRIDIRTRRVMAFVVCSTR